MNEKKASSKDILLYLFFVSLGVILVLLSFLVENETGSGLLLNIGATLISTSLLSFLHQKFGTQKNLASQILQAQGARNEEFVEGFVQAQTFSNEEIAKQIVQSQQSSNKKLLEKIIQSQDSSNGELKRQIIKCLPITQKGFELGICDMWRERRAVPNGYWNTFTQPAKAEVWLFGIAALPYAEDQTFHSILSNGTTQGCRYRILLLNPESDSAKKLDQMETKDGQVQARIRRALSLFKELKSGNDRKSGTIEIRVCSEIPHVNIVRADSELLVTQYMPPLLGYDLFTIRVKEVSGGIFFHYEKYFNETWSQSRIWQGMHR